MELKTLKRQLFIIIGLLLLISGVATFTDLSGVREANSKVGIPQDADPARVKACNDFMMVAIFPDEGAADAFFQKCITGEEKLPQDESLPMADDKLFLEIRKECDEIMSRTRFTSEEAREQFYVDCLNGRN